MMVQAIGAVLVLLGGMAWHIAHSANGSITGVSDIWQDYLDIMRGQSIGNGSQPLAQITTGGTSNIAVTNPYVNQPGQSGSAGSDVAKGAQ